MGLRGPKSLPSNVHRLRGNPSKLPAHKLTDSVAPDIEIPGCPTHLLPDAKKEWKRVAPQLEKLGLISQMDRAALAVYCQAYARWVQAEEKIKALGEAGLIEETPSGYKQIAVWLQISNRAVEQMHKFMCEFGMSPSSRSRVTASPQTDLFDDDDTNRKSPGRFFT
jgi:P27 family predicted phage terminase small subunit